VTRRQMRPPSIRQLVRAVGVLVVGWVVVVGTMIGIAAWHVQRGQRAVRAAQGRLNVSDVANPNSPDRLAPVRREFAAAHALLGNPLVAPLRLVPVAGRQLRAVTSLAAATTRVAVIGQATIGKARVALNAPRRTGPQRLVAVRSLTADAAEADRELAKIDPGTSRALVGAVAHAHSEFVTRLAKLRTGLARGIAGGTAADVLLSGPRHELVLMANNAEMRVGSGMFLSAATLDTSNGSLHLGDVHATPDLLLPGDGVLPFTGDMADRWGWLHPNREWRNLGVSPQFDATAALAARMWQAAHGEPVDGVLSLDIEALKALLTGTGPIAVDGQQISAGNVEQLLLHDQYLTVTTENASQAAHKERLGRIAHAALQALQDGNFSVGRLASALGGVTAGRHFLAWSPDASQQRRWQDAGVAGTLGPDSLLVGVANRGGNKLDPYLAVDSAISVRPGPTATQVTVTVHLANRTPAGQPDYIMGTFPGSGVQPGDYLGLVSVTMPGTATGVAVDGSAKVNAYGRDGPTKVVAVQKVVRPGGTAEVVVHFGLPEAHGTMRVSASARVPAVKWALVGSPTRWVDDQARLIAW
jgi:hypothetical protein